MNSDIENYNNLVDFIGNIIKATSDPNDQEDIDKALNIAHTIGDVLKPISDNDDKK